MKTTGLDIEELIGRSDILGRIGLIVIDLGLCGAGGDFVSRCRDAGFNWPDRFAGIVGRQADGGDAENAGGRSLSPGEIRFGDEIGGHLWIYAALPTDLEEDKAETHLQTVAVRIKRSIAADAVSAGQRGSDRYGIGCALLREQERGTARDAVYEAVLRAAERMGQSKTSDPESERRIELERIIADSGIRSVYQPIARLGDGRVFGYEALTRCPEESLFDGPLALFSFAEKVGNAYALDRLAREKAIRSCPSLGQAQKIFINVTMGIMNDPHFVSGQTIRWLREKGLNPGQVVFELTERSSIEDFEAAKKILAHYRSQGYEIAIDDAGAGYSSLQSIVELRPDYIKVDRSLVQMADKDEMKKQMLRTFVRFAKKMNIRTVAEGIERPEELRLLRAMGFDYAQGYLIGRPSEHPLAANVGASSKG